MYEVCIVPVCLYGSENWLLTDRLLDSLESFQSEVGEGILNLPKHHSNQCPLIALKWPSMRLRILKRKMIFLLRLMKLENSSISAKVFRSLRESDTEPLVVQQCKYQKQAYNTNFTQTILTDIKSIFKVPEKADHELTWIHVKERPSLKPLSRSISWPKLWDIARDRGIQGAISLQAILSALTIPTVYTFSEMKCPLCNTINSKEVHFSNHFVQTHLSMSLEGLIGLLEEESD